METTIKSKFKHELEALATIRDELKLKAHLARQDVKDEIARLETKMLRADEEMGHIKANTKTEIERLGTDFKDLLVELKQGFESVKRRLS